jgi:hypothetical protein
VQQPAAVSARESKPQWQGTLGGLDVALIVLILVGIVVTQTWLDWRDTKKAWAAPEWGKGVALGGLIAVSLAAASSFAASVWIPEEGGEWAGGFGSSHFWLELGFLASMMAAVAYGIHKKRLRLMLLLGCAITAAFVFGMSL